MIMHCVQGISEMPLKMSGKFSPELGDWVIKKMTDLYFLTLNYTGILFSSTEFN